MHITPAAGDPAVLVGVDGTETALHAVDWAAAEAQLRRAPEVDRRGRSLTW